MKKIAYLLLLVFAISTASAQFTVEGTDNDSQIVQGDRLFIQFNTSRNSNFSIDILNPEGDVKLSDAHLNMTYNSTADGKNKSYYLYTRNYTIPSGARVGGWEARLFDVFTQISSQKFQVSAVELSIIGVNDQPFFKNTEDNIEILAELTNVNESVQSINLTLGNSSYGSMNLVSETESILTYSEKVGELPEGDYSYQVEVKGEDGTQDSETGGFHVYPRNRDADRVEVSVGITPSCGISVRRFRPPGGGILQQNSSGFFSIRVRNNGSAAANITGNLTVTYQNESRWQPEDGRVELGPELNLSYAPINRDYVNVEESISESRFFNDSDELGYYTGHLNLTGRCALRPGGETISAIEEVSLKEHVNFRILSAESIGGDRKPVGNGSSPEDSNRTGEESNTTIEGDNANPGQTPVPEPQPQPVPEPQPQPAPGINIESWNTTPQIPRGRYSRIDLEVLNFGSQSVGNITLSPLGDTLPGTWNIRDASIANLSVNETVNRSVFIQPEADVPPGTYRLTITGSNSRTTLDIEKLEVTVKQEVAAESQVRIAEAPGVVRIVSGSNQRIPLLVQNTGSSNIQNYSVEIQNLEDCGTVNTSSITGISPNESVSIGLSVNASSNIQNCNSTIIISTPDGSYSFTNIRFEVTPEKGIVPPKLRFPVFAIAWTLLLLLYSLAMTRLHLDTLRLRVPYVILIVGEAAIFLYISSQYGLIPPELLPF